MSKCVNKTLSSILVLMLLFAPLDAIYAANLHSCDDMDMMVANDGVEDSAGSLQSQAQSMDSGTCFCLEKLCCCDMDACSCAVAALHLFVSDIEKPGASCAPNSSRIILSPEHYVQHDVMPLLRPPNA